MSTCSQYLPTRRGEDTTEHWANFFHILVIQGKIRSTVQVDCRQGQGRGLPARGDITQYRQVYVGSPPLEATWHLTSDGGYL